MTMNYFERLQAIEKLIAFHMTIGGYKQEPGTSMVTLSKGKIKLQIQLIEVAA